jgi:prepilin-type N-terminal cleavage/methylation domain-containing protein
MSLKSQRGFSLVEVVVTITLLGLVLASIGRMSTVISVSARKNDLIARRMAVMQLEANKMGGIPYDSVTSFPTTTKTFTWGGFSYTRKLTITSPNATYHNVKIVITPTNTTIKADSITLQRSKPSTATSLCTTC